VVLRTDATPHEDAKIAHESWMAQYRAEYKKQQQDSAKTFNQAKQDVASYELRLELEQMRLDEIKKGPTPTDVINGQTNSTMPRTCWSPPKRNSRPSRNSPRRGSPAKRNSARNNSPSRTAAGADAGRDRLQKALRP